jgi:hypothetical protein
MTYLAVIIDVKRVDGVVDLSVKRLANLLIGGLWVK